MNQIFTPFFSIMTEGSRQREIDYSSETIFFFYIAHVIAISLFTLFFFSHCPTCWYCNLFLKELYRWQILTSQPSLYKQKEEIANFLAK